MQDSSIAKKHDDKPELDKQVTTIAWSELENAYMWVSTSSFPDHRAFFCRESGKSYWDGYDGLPEGEIPDDLEFNDKYRSVPNQYDLDVGKRLVLKLASEVMSDDYYFVRKVFSRSGAYSRWQDFLIEQEQQENWYQYRDNAIKVALCNWAESEGFQVDITK
ncbi:MAG: hypothetical protein GX804_11250 [Lentisphaerae bacterium]|nr:hypothetical protein [Lentisphaerota bacterium]